MRVTRPCESYQSFRTLIKQSIVCWNNLCLGNHVTFTKNVVIQQKLQFLITFISNSIPLNYRTLIYIINNMYYILYIYYLYIHNK